MAIVRWFTRGIQLVFSAHQSLWAVLLIAGCSSQQPATGLSDSVSLAAADRFHDRLTMTCQRLGLAAMYRGAFAHGPLVAGLRPTYTSGRWDIVPESAFLQAFPGEGIPASRILEKNDMLFSVGFAPVSGHAIPVRVNGERVLVYVGGVDKSFLLPRTRISVLVMLLSCSDGQQFSWDPVFRSRFGGEDRAWDY